MYIEMFLIFFVRGVIRGGGSLEVLVYFFFVGEMILFDVNNIFILLVRMFEFKDV